MDTKRFKISHFISIQPFIVIPWNSLAFGIYILNLSITAHAQAQDYSFTGIGFLDGINAHNEALGISGDGRTVVGYSRPISYGRRHAYRWTAGSGFEDLGVLSISQPYATAEDVSYDGGTVVGGSSIASFQAEAFRWTAANGMQGLGFLGGGGSVPASRAFGVSGDGNTVVGSS
ncbi:hypothetical protein, partial [Cognatishimia sp. MH4019]|uniref:hypothetical protein n=1 Tax=Cognatishimia sp. MH4019 TaxID=2854030 RepID=UPI00351CC67D